MATATKSTPKFEVPKFELPKFNFDAPKFNLDAVVSMHQANVDTLVQAQSVVLKAVEQIAQLQYGWVQDAWKNGEALFKGDVAKKKPEEFLAEAKAAAEKVFAVAKEQTDLGLKAQAEVADLVAKRVHANLEEAKTLAA